MGFFQIFSGFLGFFQGVFGFLSGFKFFWVSGSFWVSFGFRVLGAPVGKK
jgi:hypothetical protein